MICETGYPKLDVEMSKEEIIPQTDEEFERENKKEKLKPLLEKIENSEISSIKNVTQGIIRIINDPDSNAKDLKDIVEIDPPLTAKVLRTANSAYYFSRVHISDIEQAVIWIGFDKLKEIALSQKVCEIFQKKKTVRSYSRERLWKHSVATAILGKMIYRMEFGERGENIYVAGLLHDIGIITEDQFFWDEFKMVLERVAVGRTTFLEDERATWGYDHSDIGEAISENWQFPPQLCACIGAHHNPFEAPEEHRRMAATLFMSNFLCHEAKIGFFDKYTADRVTFDRCLDFLGMDKMSLDLIVDDMKVEIQKMEAQGWF